MLGIIAALIRDLAEFTAWDELVAETYTAFKPNIFTSDLSVAYKYDVDVPNRAGWWPTQRVVR
jgi:hypothetical protein